MHKMAVAASERYNTRIEAHLRDSLGVGFEARAGMDQTKRPIRELVGVEEKLSSAWSSRRRAIDTRRAELATKFQKDHGRPIYRCADGREGLPDGAGRFQSLNCYG